MDFSPREIFFDCNTEEYEHPRTDISEPTPIEAAASQVLTADEQVGRVYVAPLTVDDTVPPTGADGSSVKSYPVETVDEVTRPIYSSDRSEPLSEVMRSRLQEFASLLGEVSQQLVPASETSEVTLQKSEALPVEVMRQLERTDDMNEDGSFPMVEEHSTTIRHLLLPIVLGIGEMQACIVNICSVKFEVSLRMLCGYTYCNVFWC